MLPLPKPGFQIPATAAHNTLVAGGMFAGRTSEQRSNRSHVCEIRHCSGSDFYSKASKG